MTLRVAFRKHLDRLRAEMSRDVLVKLPRRHYSHRPVAPIEDIRGRGGHQ